MGESWVEESIEEGGGTGTQTERTRFSETPQMKEVHLLQEVVSTGPNSYQDGGYGWSLGKEKVYPGQNWTCRARGAKTQKGLVLEAQTTGISGTPLKGQGSD